MNIKQLVVVVLAVVLIGVLLVQPIKGLVDKNKGVATESLKETVSLYSRETVSDMSKKSISSALAQDITHIEKQVGEAQGEDKVRLLQELADKWEDVNKAIPQGFIYEEMALLSPTVDHWVRSGDAYRRGYTNLQDTAMASDLTQRAMRAYEKALELDGANLSAKTGLGSAMVTGTANPMAGIALLREVVQKEPKNIDANRALGLFSLQSQQFDKAIDRFKVVVEQKPDAESYFYLATGYEKIGLNNEAIAAYQKSKELAADPTLSQYIDRQIEALGKK